MRREKTLIYLTLVVTLLSATLNVYAVGNLSSNMQEKLEEAIILYIGNSKAYVNLEEVSVDHINEEVYPLIKDSKTLVPVRFISENFGAKVGWDGVTRTVTIKTEEDNIKIVLDSNKMLVNSQEVTLEVPAQLIEGSTFIPLRALVESLGKEVFYDRGLIIISDFDNIFDANNDKDEITQLINLFDEVKEANTEEASSNEKSKTPILRETIRAERVIQDGEWIYYVTDEKFTFHLYKMREDGTEKSVLNRNHSSSLNIVEDWIYFTNGRDNHLYKMQLDGTDKTQLDEDKAQSAVVFGDWIYYSNWSDNWEIYKIKTDGTRKTKVSDDRARNLVINNDMIYYNNSNDKGALYRMDINSGETEKVTELNTHSLIFQDDWIIFIDQPSINRPGLVYKMKTDGTQLTQLSEDRAFELAVMGQWIYYTKYFSSDKSDGGHLYKMKLDGSDATQLNDRVSRIDGVVDQWIFFKEMIRIDGANIYSEQYRVRLDGMQEERVNLL